MIIFLILAMLVLVVALVFAIQNPGVYLISLLFWQFETSLTVVVLIAFALGALVVFLAMIPNLVKLRLRTRTQDRTIKKMSDSLPPKDTENR